MRNALLIAGALGAVVTTGPSTAAAPAQTYAIVDKISGTGGAWDYAVIDQSAKRLYLAQQGVTGLDLKTNQLATGLVPGKTTHGVAILGDGKVAVDDSTAKTVTVFEGATGKILQTIDTTEQNPANGRHALDALVLEPKSGLLATINGESGLLLLLDLRQGKVVGTVTLGGEPEFAAADGKGRLYINAQREKAAEIIGVDVAARAVVAHIPLKGCEDPTGLAYDRSDDLLISVCGNGVAKFVHPDSGREAASLEVAKGADAVIFDAERQRAFVPGAESGALSVIAVRGANDIAVIQTLATQKGTRLGAVDSASGKLYLPTAKFGPPVPPSSHPSVIHGTFEILVVAPK